MRFDEADDAELFQRALAGEEAAFTALYRRWQGKIYRFALRLSGSASMAEDVTQDVFLALIDAGSGFDPALGSFSAYLYGIARNQALRRINRERRFELIGDGSDGAELAADRSGYSIPADPFGTLTDQERIESLHRAISVLPLLYREVVILCDLQELNYAEAARVLGCPEGTLRSRLHRARVLLLHKIRTGSNEEIRPQTARCLR